MFRTEDKNISVLREALVAVPLSAAGWQQSTAGSKLKFRPFFFLPLFSVLAND